MSIVIISICSFLISMVTFFSGFGLGTVLTPVFAIWFPIDLAIALTAIVHLLNNLFKLGLIGKHYDLRIVLRFGIPAILGAVIGAWILTYVSDWSSLMSYTMFGREFLILPVKLVIAILLCVFTLFEVIPELKNWAVDQKYIPVGGLLSGFFGGLSGHQGALRSAFLLRSGLSKETFIATGVVIACFIDVIRLGVYSQHFATAGISDNLGLLVAATLSAFIGAYIGNHFLKKITMNSIQTTVAASLFILAMALGSGII